VGWGGKVGGEWAVEYGKSSVGVGVKVDGTVGWNAVSRLYVLVASSGRES
jgi:hypothetical protein